MGRFVRDEERSHRTAFVILGLAFGLATVWAVVDEVQVRRPWKAWQDRYHTLLAQKSGDLSALQTGPSIQQVVVPALEVVDRCQTCHAGIDDRRMVGQDVPAALRLHPEHPALLGPHPPHRIGCTPCHRGQGLALTAGTAHGPDDPHWEEPLERGAYVQSSCLGCHPANEALAGAPQLGTGRRLFRELGCAGCHMTGDQDLEPKRGPSLRKVAAKLAPGYMLAWIKAPQARRATHVMPDFWPGADKDPTMAAARDREALAMAAYLLQSSEPYPEADQAPPRDEALVEEGKRLFDHIGCRGCHMLGGDGADALEIRDPAAVDKATEASWESFGGDEEEEGGDEPAPVAPPEAVTPINFGPPLGEVGARTGPGWLYAWVRAPESYWKLATMPGLRLNRAESHALASWMSSLGADKRPETPAALTPPIDPKLVATGQRLIADYGCAGCHDIPGFEDAGQPGPDLLTYGRKYLAEMHFGDHPPPRAERTWDRYTRTKLATPRAFQTKEIRQVMPAYQLDAAQVQAIAVYLRGLRGKPMPPELIHDPPVAKMHRVAGRLIGDRGCRGCHTLDKRDGDILRYYKHIWLAPPSLDGVGGKTQPQWLFRYLVRPGPLRPWLQARMPDFRLAQDDAETLVGHFAALAGKKAPLRPLTLGAMTQARAALGADFFVKLKCVSCHLLKQGKDVKTAELAPDLALARERLDPTWVRQFLYNPGAILPGTRMPQFFPQGQTPFPELLGGDLEAQIQLLVDHLMNLGLQPAGRPDDEGLPAPQAATPVQPAQPDPTEARP